MFLRPLPYYIPTTTLKIRCVRSPTRIPDGTFFENYLLSITVLQSPSPDGASERIRVTEVYFV